MAEAEYGDAMHDDGERLPTDPDQVDDTVYGEDIDPFLHDNVLRWRARRLRDNGMNPRQARTLALDRRVDVHDVVENMLKKGCDPLVAFDIASF